MIIVSGRVLVAPEHVEAFLSASRDAIVQARRTPACLDFVVAADPLDPGRINVYERWESVATLKAFRGDGPGPDLAAMIVSADVSTYEIASAAAI